MQGCDGRHDGTIDGGWTTVMPGPWWLRKGHPKRWRLHRWIATLLLVAVTGMCAVHPPTSANAERPSPDEVEAAYLYNFGKFATWPPQAANGTLTICITGADDLSRLAEQLVQGERIGGRPLAAERVDRTSDVKGCSILFIGGTEQEHLEGYLEAAAGKPILTVGDSPDFLRHGGIIQFVPTGSHVRFSINLDAARQNHLKLSSELLKVAFQVKGKPGPGGAQ